MNVPTIVAQDEWLPARKKLLAKEKKTRQRDALSQARRELPMLKVEKEYACEGPNGPMTLRDLFGPHQQLIIYVAYTTPSPLPISWINPSYNSSCGAGKGCAGLSPPKREVTNVMRHSIYWSLGLALALAQLTGCQKRAPFNPALAGHFFPLCSGLTWTYQVTYPNGARETIRDRVVMREHQGMAGDTAVVVTDYSGLDETRAQRAELPRTYPPELTEVETAYTVDGDYLNQMSDLGGRPRANFVEHGFLPRSLWPNRSWSSTASPFKNVADDFLQISQVHHSFLETDDVVVPAGRFSECLRVETEASYQSVVQDGQHRYFIDWYAPDVGLVKTLVRSNQLHGPELSRIELLRFTDIVPKAPPHSVAGHSLTSAAAKSAHTSAPLVDERTAE